MKKVRLFFVAVILLLTTAGVFAGRTKFQASAIPNLYFYNGAYIWICNVSSYNMAVLSLAGQECAKLGSCTGTSFPMYTYVNGAYHLVYNVAF